MVSQAQRAAQAAATQQQRQLAAQQQAAALAHANMQGVVGVGVSAEERHYFTKSILDLLRSIMQLVQNPTTEEQLHNRAVQFENTVFTDTRGERNAYINRVNSKIQDLKNKLTQQQAAARGAAPPPPPPPPPPQRQNAMPTMPISSATHSQYVAHHAQTAQHQQHQQHMAAAAAAQHHQQQNMHLQQQQHQQQLHAQAQQHQQHRHHAASLAAQNAVHAVPAAPTAPGGGAPGDNLSTFLSQMGYGDIDASGGAGMGGADLFGAIEPVDVLGGAASMPSDPAMDAGFLGSFSASMGGMPQQAAPSNAVAGWQKTMVPTSGSAYPYQAMQQQHQQHQQHHRQQQQQQQILPTTYGMPVHSMAIASHGYANVSMPVTSMAMPHHGQMLMPTHGSAHAGAMAMGSMQGAAQHQHHHAQAQAQQQQQQQQQALPVDVNVLTPQQREMYESYWKTLDKARETYYYDVAQIIRKLSVNHKEAQEANDTARVEEYKQSVKVLYACAQSLSSKREKPRKPNQGLTRACHEDLRKLINHLERISRLKKMRHQREGKGQQLPPQQQQQMPPQQPQMSNAALLHQQHAMSSAPMQQLYHDQRAAAAMMPQGSMGMPLTVAAHGAYHAHPGAMPPGMMPADPNAMHFMPTPYATMPQGVQMPHGASAPVTGSVGSRGRTKPMTAAEKRMAQAQAAAQAQAQAAAAQGYPPPPPPPPPARQNSRGRATSGKPRAPSKQTTKQMTKKQAAAAAAAAVEAAKATSTQDAAATQDASATALPAPTSMVQRDGRKRLAGALDEEDGASALKRAALAVTKFPPTPEFAAAAATAPSVASAPSETTTLAVSPAAASPDDATAPSMAVSGSLEQKLFGELCDELPIMICSNELEGASFVEALM
ncbi:hypothetical protein NFJ02_35g88290 [Pycnococcus provasolii]